jgi:hypothetical protein
MMHEANAQIYNCGTGASPLVRVIHACLGGRKGRMQCDVCVSAGIIINEYDQEQVGGSIRHRRSKLTFLDQQRQPFQKQMGQRPVESPAMYGESCQGGSEMGSG